MRGQRLSRPVKGLGAFRPPVLLASQTSRGVTAPAGNGRMEATLRSPSYGCLMQAGRAKNNKYLAAPSGGGRPGRPDGPRGVWRTVPGGPRLSFALWRGNAQAGRGCLAGDEHRHLASPRDRWPTVPLPPSYLSTSRPLDSYRSRMSDPNVAMCTQTACPNIEVLHPGDRRSPAVGPQLLARTARDRPARGRVPRSVIPGFHRDTWIGRPVVG
jgi:hypothetical protein